ncbi:MAG TPA: hypothetical protein VMB04_18490 [Mycobacterium sp.]|nr:hypothetical protein [Mycobacterium sp.]
MGTPILDRGDDLADTLGGIHHHVVSSMSALTSTPDEKEGAFNHPLPVAVRSDVGAPVEINTQIEHLRHPQPRERLDS